MRTAVLDFYSIVIHIFQENQDKIDNIFFLESSKNNDFNRISSDIGRSKTACHLHWKNVIVPVLKSHTLNLPQNVEWQKHVLRYVIENKFTNIKNISYNKVVINVCPGQTSCSLSLFLRNVSQHAKDTPFHESCKKFLNNPYPNSYLGNEELAQKKSEYAFKILEIKQKLKSN